MVLHLKTITARLHCTFKSWQTQQQTLMNDVEKFTSDNITLPVEKITPKDKFAISAWAIGNLPDTAACS